MSIKCWPEIRRNCLVLAGLVALFSSAAFTIGGQETGLKESMTRGRQLYMSNCSSCHMPTGEGIARVFPPLAGSDYLMNDLDRSVREILYGVKGEMTVNGILYNGEMNAFNFTDQETADVLNYIRNTWGNSGQMVTAEKVKSLRK